MIDLHRALSCLNSHQLRQVWNEGSLFSPISTGTCSSAAAKVPQLLPVKRYKIRSHYDGVFSLDFTKDGTRLAVGYGSGDVTLHDTKTAKLTCCPSRKSEQLPVTGLQFRSQDRSEMLYCLASGPIFLQRIEDESNVVDVMTTDEENEINTLDVSEFGYYFCTAGKDRNIRIYDWEKFKPFSVLGPLTEGDYIGPPEDTLTQHGKRIFSVKFSDESPYHLVSGGWDNSVKVWDLRTGQVVKSMSTGSNFGPKLCGDALAIKGDLCVTGSLLPENAIELWSIKEGRRIACLPYESPKLRGEYVLVVKFCGDNHVIAGSATCHDAQIISIAQEKVVSRIDGFRRSVSSLAVSSSGKVAVAGGAPYISFVETMTTPFFLET
ncbi:uncharacterized protein LOC134811531 isoform X1 [Bolinopsis microptera]|uniref:uncharacterized protein LOC134811531 isoform X1 n=1 Tax=Bolinopsis microptera TaxID=2820187 RepID=UPI00307A8E05